MTRKFITGAKLFILKGQELLAKIKDLKIRKMRGLKISRNAL